MSQRPWIPSIETFRPVENVGPEEVAAVRQVLTDGEGNELGGPGALRKLFAPARMLRAELLAPVEIMRFHARIGHTDATQEEMEALAVHMKEKLGGDHSLEPPTLPHEVRPLGQGKLLTIAGSTYTIRERIQAKQALTDFYELKNVPRGFWLNDTLTSRVWLARSFAAPKNWLIDRLDITLEHDPSGLPERTTLGPIECHAAEPPES